MSLAGGGSEPDGRAGRASLAVADLLDAPGLPGVVPLAGLSGLGRPLAWVARFEDPADAAGAGPGDLLLVQDGGALGAAAPGLGARLAARGIAGLALADGVALPAGLLDEAEAAGLPVLVLPGGSGYRALSLAIAGLATRADAAAPTGPGSPGGSVAPVRASGLLAALSADGGAALVEACLGSGLRKLHDHPEIELAVAAWLRHGGNAIAAAAELGVHRHTVRARLRRYAEATGLDLEDHDARLAVELAFRLAGR